MILNIALASVILVCLGILVIAYISHKHHKPGYGISLLVPFRSDNGRREETWNWLREYWHHELPGAEIIVGTNDDTPFCKTMAFNQAANKARGDVFVLMDADCYLPGSVVIDCANEIRRERKRGNRIWFIPYRWFYRLNSSSSQAIINSDYRNPPRFFSAPPSKFMLDETKAIAIGHFFGALIQIMPSEAFWIAGGADTRFRGWGGEDVAFMHAVDTLYASHKTLPNGVIHLWHPTNGTSHDGSKRWEGQIVTNGALATEYFRASGDYDRMRDLVDGRTEIPGIPLRDQPRFYS